MPKSRLAPASLLGALLIFLAPFGRKKLRLTDKTTGTWKYLAGVPKGKSKIRFTKGAMNKTVVEVVRDKKPKRTFFNILWKGKPSGISCYVVEKP